MKIQQPNNPITQQPNNPITQQPNNLSTPLHLPWRVVQTRSRSEKKVAGWFDRLGIEYYLPLQKRKKQWSDRVKTVEEPLFSGYIFARFGESDRYSLLCTAGVVRIVSFGGTYAEMPEEQIKALRQMDYLDSDVIVVEAGLITGQDVMISSGPFKGLEGKLLRHDGKGKLLIEITAIGKGVVIELGRTKVTVRPHAEFA